MLGQTQQNRAPQQGQESLEGKLFEQRRAGFYKYRIATPFWRDVVLQTLAKWYATGAKSAAANVEQYTVAAPVAMPPHMGTFGRSTGDELIRQLEAQGWGVIFAAKGEKGTLIRSKSAKLAEQLTLDDPTKTTFVLSEPRDGWQDTNLARYVVLPMGFVVGFVGMMAAIKAIRK